VTYVGPRGLIFTAGVDARKVQINSTLERNFRPLAEFGSFQTDLELVPFVFGGRLPGGPSITPREYSGATLAAGGMTSGLFQTLATNPDSSIRIRFTELGFFEQSDMRLRS